MVSACSSDRSMKPAPVKRGQSASDMLAELTLGFANWISIPGTSRRPRSDSAESSSSSISAASSDTYSSGGSGINSPTDVTSTSKHIVNEAYSLFSDIPAPKLQSVARLRKTAQNRQQAQNEGTEEAHKVEEERIHPKMTEIKQNDKGHSDNKPVWPCVLYGACACLIHICNKGFFSVWEFHGTFVFSLAQSIITCCLFALALALGLWRVPAVTWATQQRLLLLPLLFVCNTSFALIGLQHTSLPMYLVLRRMVTPAVLLSEYLVWGRSSSPGVVAACALLFLGSVVAGASDLRIDLFGYACTTVANVFTVAYTMYMKELSSTVTAKVQVTDIIFFNALYSIPLLLAAGTMSGELSAAAAYPHLTAPLFQASLFGASAMGLLYQAAMVLANTRTSPLATSLAGNVKDVACSAVGYMLFDSGPLSPTNIVGLAMSMCGAFWYVALKTNLIR